MSSDKPLEYRFSSTTIAEHEVAIQLDRATGLAYIASSWPAKSRQIISRYGPPERTTTSSKDGGIATAFWRIPIRLITFRRPPQSKAAGNPENLRRGRKKG